MARRVGGKQLVIAFFASPVAGDIAARTLAKEANARGRGGTIGVLALDDDGKVEVARLGAPTTDGGTGIGAVLGKIASALSGRVLPRRKHFFDARSDLSTDDIARLGAELEAGQAAVAVLEHGPEAEHIVLELTELGGKTEVHHLTSRALRQAASAPTNADR